MPLSPEMDLAFNAVLDAVKSGEIRERRINESVRRILEVKAERGLCEDPYVDESAVGASVGTEENREAAAAVSDDTVTLVKNEADTLPLESDAGQKVLIIGAGGVAGSQADEADRSTLGSLAYQIGQRGATTQVYETGSNPNDARITEAGTQAADNDLVVVTTNRASTSAGQNKLVNALLETGKPVIVVATRDPYDIAYFDEAQTYVATYSYRAVSMGALARVLFGEVDPSGKLPVDIPASDDPDTVLYPYGHGLGYGGRAAVA